MVVAEKAFGMPNADGFVSVLTVPKAPKLAGAPNAVDGLKYELDAAPL